MSKQDMYAETHPIHILIALDRKKFTKQEWDKPNQTFLYLVRIYVTLKSLLE